MKKRTIILTTLMLALTIGITAQKLGRRMFINEGGKIVGNYLLPEKVDSITFKVVEFYNVTTSATEGGTVTPESEIEIEQDSLITFTATPAEEYVFVNWTVNGEEVSKETSYITTITENKEIKANFKYIYATTGSENGKEYVDLGLPSGIKWAACNVGASAPEEYGDYFAWGETSTKNSYSSDWSNYKYCEGSQTSMTKYCTNSNYGKVDNRTTLRYSDDAAHINWGGNWRMPTKTELEELKDTTYCTWTWVKFKEKNGYRVTSKINGNSIFLPAAGLRYAGNILRVGSESNLWSSSLGSSLSYAAYSLEANSSNAGSINAYNSRFYGLSVRAVCLEELEPLPIYIITVSSNGTMGTAISSASEAEEDATITLTATPKDGYRFVNWTVDGVEVSTENPYIVTITANKEFVANFEEDKIYQINLNSQWRKSSSVANPNEALFDGVYESYSNYNTDDSEASMTIEIKGYTEFTLYVRSDGENNYDYVTVSELDSPSSIKYTAKGNANSGSSISCYTPVTFSGIDGEIHTITIKYIKDGLLSSGSDRGYILIPKNKIGEVIQTCTVKVSSSDATKGTVTASATEVEEGETITLTAKPKDGYEFINWTQNGEVVSTENPYIVTITADTEFVANFEEEIQIYTVKVSSSDATKGTVTASATEVEEGETITLTAMPNEGYKFVNWTVNGEEVSTENPYTATITENSDFVANFKEDPYNGHEYVDLGLPSGVKWATCNVGATTPEEYGDYFAWGETTTKDNYSSSTYTYTRTNSKLPMSADAAHVNWGGNWRMPTQTEQEELINNCTCEWISKNGINGYKVTSKINGNSIFLPAAGYRRDDEPLAAGSCGYYWSSSTKVRQYQQICYLSFGLSNVNTGEFTSSYDGYSVRAVCESSAPIVCTVSVFATEGGTAETSATEVKERKNVTLTATPNEGYLFVGWTLNGEVVSTENPYIATITENREYVATFESIYEPIGMENGYGFIDLGLSVKWATCNVGADSPEDYGDYYSWGETTIKSSYTESNYNPSSGSNPLPLSADAACVNWGGAWRMPTDVEQRELISNCTCTWTSYNGVNGYKVTSNKNGNSIFLPAAGYCESGNRFSAGDGGYYWSSSRPSRGSGVYDLFFDSSNGYTNTFTKHYGLSIRAVRESSIPTVWTVSVLATEGGTAEVSNPAVEGGSNVTLTATPNKGYKFVNWTLNGKVVSTENPYVATIIEKSEFKANFETLYEPTGSENGYDYVDLGLPSGVKWATCNVGADTPEGYGNYYAWGEITTKDKYTSSTYTYAITSSILPMSDDVANVNLGGNWRIPTKKEFEELKDTANCTWTKVTLKGKNGYRVTSNKNGNSIFLPAAGYRTDSSLNGVGNGNYWSSSLDTSCVTGAYSLYFGSDYVRMSSCDCSVGRSVRAVCE